MLTTMHRSRLKGPLRAIPGATNNRKIGKRLCYCDNESRSLQIQAKLFLQTSSVWALHSFGALANQLAST